MRIRKQPREVNVGLSSGSCRRLSIAIGGDCWGIEHNSEIVTDGTLLVEEDELDASAHSKQQLNTAPVAAKEGHNLPERVDAAVKSRYVYTRSLQECNTVNPDAVDKVNVLSDPVPSEEQGDMLSRRKGGKRSPLLFGPKSSHISGHSKRDASALAMDTGIGKVDRTRDLNVSESSCFQTVSEQDDNATTQYSRRSQCKGRDGMSEEQSDCADAGLLATVCAYENQIDVINQSECDQFSVPGTKTEAPTHGVVSTQKLPTTEIRNSYEERDRPSREPEGSLLRSLYLHLLAAGREGVTVEELFASFETQITLPTHASYSKDQLRSDLRSNPCFEDVNGRYALREQLVQPTLKGSVKRDPIPDVSHGHDNSVNPKSDYFPTTLKTDVLQSNFTAVCAPLRMSSVSHSSGAQEGVQTRRRAYQKTIEAVLSESVIEYQRMQQDKVNGSKVSTTSSEWVQSSTVGSVTEQITEAQPQPAPRLNKKRKASEKEKEFPIKTIRNGGAVPGSLKEMQAKIAAETGAQNGVRCARKDGSNSFSKWQCPMMAMDGGTLCEHHNFLNDRKKARYAKKQRERRLRQLPQNKVERSTFECKKHITDGSSLLGAGVQTCKRLKKEFVELDEFASQALVNMRRDNQGGKPQELTNDIDFQVDEKLKIKEPSRFVQDMLPHSFRNAPKGRFVAAKKTAAKTPTLTSKEVSPKKQSAPLIRPPTIPPLPVMYGMRRKSAKNRSLLSL